MDHFKLSNKYMYIFLYESNYLIRFVPAVDKIYQMKV